MSSAAAGTFRYVYIPAVESSPVQERSISYSVENEVGCLMEALKKHFT